jgi:hypothetical protein
MNVVGEFQLDSAFLGVYGDLGRDAPFVAHVDQNLSEALLFGQVEDQRNPDGLAGSLHGEECRSAAPDLPQVLVAVVVRFGELAATAGTGAATPLDCGDRFLAVEHRFDKGSVIGGRIRWGRGP